MTPETLTLCVAVVALTGLAVWLLDRLAATEADRDRVTDERDAAQVCRDAARRERNAAVSALEALRTVHKLDPDETWEDRVVELTKQVTDAVTLAHAEQLRRVEAERRPAVCDWIAAVARGEAAGHLVIAADAEPEPGRDRADGEVGGGVTPHECDCERFGYLVPGYSVGSNWPWVPCPEHQHLRDDASRKREPRG